MVTVTTKLATLGQATASFLKGVFIYLNSLHHAYSITLYQRFLLLKKITCQSLVLPVSCTNIEATEVWNKERRSGYTGYFNRDRTEDFVSYDYRR